jgi:transketolase
MASGSEVGLVMAAAEKLAEEGVSARVVSFPSWELFEKQEQAYRQSVIRPDVKARVAVEAGVGQGWERYVGESGKIISLEHFGASAPAEILFEQFGFTIENVIAAAREVLSANLAEGK